MKLLNAALAAGIKGLMAICLMLAIFGIPYLVVSTTWGWLAQLWRDHPVWCVVLVIPIVWIAIKVMKWGLETTGALMVGVGAIVDKLER